MNKKVICFLIPSFKGGGAEKQCALIVNGLAKTELFDIHLIYYKDGVNSKVLNKQEVNIHKIEIGSFNNPRSILKAYRKIKSISPDILFSWIAVCDVYAGLIKKLNSDMIWVAAERNSDYNKSWKHKLRVCLVQQADHIIANSNTGRDFWINKNKPNTEVSVIKNILKIRRPSNKNLLDGNPIILYVGRFEKQKNVLNLVHLFSQYALRNKEAKLYCIGEGSLKDKMIEIIKAKEVDNQVKLLSYKEDIENYFASADVFVSLSHREGTPNTLLESVSLNLISIVSNIPEHHEILGDDYPYYYMKNSAFEKFNQLINRSLKDNKVAERLGFARVVLETFTEEKIIEKYKNVFLQLLKNK